MLMKIGIAVALLAAGWSLRSLVDPGELRDAQLHPERYGNLQVRVCGWNVRWNDLDRREQDAYLQRLEGIAW